MTTRDTHSLPALEGLGDASMLYDIARMEMPFGRFQGRVLIDLPEPYVVWFHRNGYPKGRIGKLLGLLYEVKTNGLEALFDPLRDPPREPEFEHMEPALRPPQK
ncbi:MAG: DUF3820 family protein [bacterium]|nr:DUF3820 family protein [bacterium]